MTCKCNCVVGGDTLKNHQTLTENTRLLTENITLRQQLENMTERYNVRKELADHLGQQLEAAHRLYDESGDLLIEQARQLAASQAREQQWLKRVASTNILLEAVCATNPDSACAKYELAENRKAIAIPQDTTALSAMIAKAGEVMRERCRKVAFDMASADSMAVDVSQSIRALPAVTLSDLK